MSCTRLARELACVATVSEGVGRPCRATLNRVAGSILEEAEEGPALQVPATAQEGKLHGSVQNALQRLSSRSSAWAIGGLRWTPEEAHQAVEARLWGPPWGPLMGSSSPVQGCPAQQRRPNPGKCREGSQEPPCLHPHLLKLFLPQTRNKRNALVSCTVTRHEAGCCCRHLRPSLTACPYCVQGLCWESDSVSPPVIMSQQSDRTGQASCVRQGLHERFSC